MRYNIPNIAERIRVERKKLHLSQDELIYILRTKDCHVGRNTISAIENGEITTNNLSTKLLMSLCEIFNCDIGYLLCEYDSKTRNEEIIKSELGLSEDNIKYLKEQGGQSIVRIPVPQIQALLNDNETIYEPVPEKERFIYSLNFILENYPELIKYLGRILLQLHRRQHNNNVRKAIYERKLQQSNYYTERAIQNLSIQLLEYTKSGKKIPTQKITDTDRYKLSLEFANNQYQALNNEITYLSHELYSRKDEPDGFYE